MELRNVTVESVEEKWRGSNNRGGTSVLNNIRFLGVDAEFACWKTPPVIGSTYSIVEYDIKKTTKKGICG